MIKNEENNEIKTAKTVVSNMKWELSDRQKGNFVLVNKEFIFLKSENGKYLTSLEERGLFFSILCLQGLNWDFNTEGLATLCNASPERINKYLKKLIQLGYIEKIDNRNEKGQFVKSTYIIHDSVIKENCKAQEYLNKNFPIKKEPNLEKPQLENSVQCNNKSIKESNNLKIKELKTKEDCYSNLIISKEVYSTPSINNDSNMFNNRNDTHDIHVEQNNLSPIGKNKKKYSRKNKTEEDKSIILPQLDKIENEELKNELKEYISMLIDKRKNMHISTLNAILNQLYSLTDDIFEQIQIVRNARIGEWQKFYMLNEKEKKEIQRKKWENKIKDETEEEPEEFEFRDENGKLITF